MCFRWLTVVLLAALAVAARGDGTACRAIETAVDLLVYASKNTEDPAALSLLNKSSDKAILALKRLSC